MKKAIVSAILVLTIIASGVSVFAAPETIDLETMSLRELDDLIDRAQIAKGDYADFMYRVRAVLTYHADKKAKTKSNAELSGQWAAFQVNEWMYSGFEKRAYYYAMYGEKEYIKEFGKDKAELKTVKDFVEKCR